MMGGVGGAYYGAYRIEEGKVVLPFSPGLAVQIYFGLEGKDVRVNTRWRAGIGGSLNPLSSAGTGELSLYLISVPIWFEYPFVRRGDLFVYGAFAFGPGFGLFRNNISGERGQTIIGNVALSVKAEIRIFFPSSFWVEFRPNIFAEFTSMGISSTLLPGAQVNMGFTNEY
ncbi:MAG: hypothetical protein ACOY5B_10510 [Spirochaetota bacterium]